MYSASFIMDTVCMDSETYGAYEIVDICCNAYREQKSNWSENERNLPLGRRVFMDTLLDKKQIKNLTQRPVPVDSAGNNKSIEKSTIGIKAKKTEPIKTINKSGKMGLYPVHVTPASRKIQFNLLMDELNHAFCENYITQKTRNIKPQLIKKDCNELYCVPNNQPAFPTEIQDKKEFTFRSRSNACISQNKKMYLKEIKYTDT